MKDYLNKNINENMWVMCDGDGPLYIMYAKGDTNWDFPLTSNLVAFLYVLLRKSIDKEDTYVFDDKYGYEICITPQDEEMLRIRIEKIITVEFTLSKLEKECMINLLHEGYMQVLHNELSDRLWGDLFDGITSEDEMGNFHSSINKLLF